MTVSRRKFLKIVASSGGALVASGVPLAPQAQARVSTVLPPQATGLLYDATLCVGCKACMVNCKTQNSVPGGALYKSGWPMPPYENGDIKLNNGIWDAPRELSGKTLNIIKVYKNGSAEVKDRAINGYAFFKQQCLHCVSPACVSVCPAGAFRKDPVNGAVYYLADRCIGCRYCQLACPFGVPRYEWDSAWPEVRKCQLCRHRQAEGKIAACAEACPTGATIFGKVLDLREEAKRRQALRPGDEYPFPIQKVGARETTLRPIAHYTDGIYGLVEAGGTQNLMLSGVPFELLGFGRNIAKYDLPRLTWAYIAKIPWVFLGVFVGGTAIYKMTHRNDKEG
ncbi:hydrogenase 2 operon protein HybA [Geomesophilobacter sediminis]|uniref:Hydrogenase 2 operon protein HybA n=1 Tax=Geomesophilobacter sediminis TaxID=2798584 RepID=A0A8J7M3C4_9BACT|nr:hydrogenase 2 operon protein HybA [Geomesophilobacter sediminis]MBJ6727809.1 hydrogenase 2 operon protein HybA [Geomesophilobacter sediminis]